MLMDYCGVEFSVVAAGGSAWKWHLSILNEIEVRSCGEAASRAAAIIRAHEAIGEHLRVNASPGRQAQLPHLISGVLHVLHGARGLPCADAIDALRPFVEGTRDLTRGNDRLADAAAAAVGALVLRLEATGVATDDLWEEAIEASLSFANELAMRARS
jgi:hypothetical protein